MAALGTLIGGELPPVGQRVCVRGTPQPPPVFAGYRPTWTHSGTAALALAIRRAMQARPQVGAPEVLLPAYGCPDLVAATLHAGARPVLVDIGGNDPAMDPAALAAACTVQTVAVVAVNFLGIRERIEDLRRFTDSRGIALVEDCAQWFPEGPLRADAVVLSFGRGKPVNLLGGGALLAAEGFAGSDDGPASPAPAGAALFNLKAALLNALLDPRAYACLRRLPGLAIGATRFHPLQSIMALDATRLKWLGTNAEAWLQRPRWRESAVADALHALDGVQLLPLTLAPRAGRLLRYPVLLADAERRDAALQRLQARGLGASAFYARALPQIDGVPEAVRAQQHVPAASDFAARLLTLPLHDGVSRDHIEAMGAAIREALQ